MKYVENVYSEFLKSEIVVDRDERRIVTRRLVAEWVKCGKIFSMKGLQRQLPVVVESEGVFKFLEGVWSLIGRLAVVEFVRNGQKFTVPLQLRLLNRQSKLTSDE